MGQISDERHMTNGNGNDGWGVIQVRGARENNLKDVDLDVPKRKLPAP